MNKVEKIKAEIGIRIAEICDLTTGCIMDSKTAAEYRLLYELTSFIDSLEEPVSEDLENHIKVCVSYLKGEITADVVAQSIRHGVQWEKDQMMKDAVEAVIHPYDGEILVDKDLLSIYDDCQRVKLIIIKDENY